MPSPTPMEIVTSVKYVLSIYRLQFSQVQLKAHSLKSGDPGLRTRSDHLLNLFLVDPGSTSQLLFK